MKPRFWIGLFLLIAGLSALFDFPLFRVVIPLVMIWIGIRIMTGRGRRFNRVFAAENEEGMYKRVLIFSAIDTRLTTKHFEGAEVAAIFGGGEIDMSGAETKESALELSVVAIFGGLKIRVPKGWQVKSDGVAIVGGFTNSTSPAAKPSVSVTLKGAAIVGGVEITN